MLLPDAKRLVLSAKSTNCRNSEILHRSFIYKIKSNNPNIDP